MHMSLQSKSSESRQPSSLACTLCRRRHLKCDGATPTCARCQDTGSECRYIPSRRGLRLKHLNYQHELPYPDAINSLAMPAGADDPLPELLSASTMADLDAATYDSIESPAPGVFARDAIIPSLGTPPTLELLDIPESDTDTGDALTFPFPQSDSPSSDLAYEPMILLYYQGFHRSHPFVLPRKALSTSLARRIPGSTLSIMRFIGAHYHPDPSMKEIFRHPAYAGLADESVFSGFRVQNMLLLAIVEHAHADESSAQHTLQMAIRLALETGMNQATFATRNSWGSTVVEESWRRTFWELYVVNGVLASMRDQKSFTLYNYAAEVSLPCEEAAYNICGAIPRSTRSIRDLKAYWSQDDGQRFTPFAYRIEATRILGEVLTLNHSLDMNDDAYVETTEASLVASLLYFPVLKEGHHSINDFDDMTFQAQMILYLCMIQLHHPRSNMRLASFNAKSSCTCFRAIESDPSVSDGELDLHSKKLLHAANMLSSLATLPGQIKHRTPFLSCALAMAVIVHVAACLMMSGPEKKESIRARMQLGLGALNALGKVWPLAEFVRKQLLGMYHDVGLGNKQVTVG